MLLLAQLCSCSLQERNELESKRQAAQLSQLSLDRDSSGQPAGTSGARVALDAHSRPAAQSADELNGHISDASD